MTQKALVTSNVPLWEYRKWMRVVQFSILLLALSLQVAANAYLVNIRGKITNANGQPLFGVSVVVQGSNVGTSTDASGNFQLSGVDDNAILVITYIGYQQQQIRVNGRTV